jgi:hypothetical protein
MNVLINELKYNPNRPPAQDINGPAIKSELDDFFRISWVADPTDVFGRSQTTRRPTRIGSTRFRARRVKRAAENLACQARTVAP